MMDYKVQIGFEFGSITVVGYQGFSTDFAWHLRCECGHESVVKRTYFNKWRHRTTCQCGLKPSFKPTVWVASHRSKPRDQIKLV